MKSISEKQAFICDMDGVVYHGNRLLPGAKEFVAWLKKNDKKYLFLTNGSERSPRELQEKLSRLGVKVGREHFFTAALATAAFLKSQTPDGSAYVIGGAGLINALYDAGISMNEINPDYVVVGETDSYTFDKVTHAINLVRNGAKLIGTSPDLTGPVEQGIQPGVGSLVAPIELATGSKAYFVGKPNTLMMRRAVKTLESRSFETVIIGDRMDTDIIAGIEAEIDTLLVLSGVTSEADMEKFAYRPSFVFDNLADITARALAGNQD